MIINFLKNYKNIILLIFIGIFIVFVIKMCNKSDEINRLSGNYYALSDTVEYYKTQSGKNASKSKDLSISMYELRNTNNKEFDRLNSVINDLKLKNKNVNQVSTSTSIIHVSDYITLNDTIFDNDTIYRYKSGKFTDPWTILTLNVYDNNKVKFDLVTNDTIDIITSKQKVGSFRFINIFKKRPTVFVSNAVMTRPGATATVKTIRINN